LNEISDGFKKLFVKMVALLPKERPTTIDSILEDDWMKEIKEKNENELKDLELELYEEFLKREEIIKKLTQKDYNIENKDKNDDDNRSLKDEGKLFFNIEDNPIKEFKKGKIFEYFIKIKGNLSPYKYMNDLANKIEEENEDEKREYDCKIESICENFDLDKDLTESGISKDKKYTIKTLLLGISFFIIFSFIFLASFTVFALITELKRTTLFINQAVEIISTVKGIQLYTHEILHQDRTIFIEKEPERILHDLIYQLEEIQSNLKSGDYGGPNYDSYPVIDHITKNKGCFELKYQNNCDPSNYDSTYGFTEEVATLPLNELLREYLFYIKNFIDNVNDEKYIKLPFVNKENIQILYQQEVNDNFFKFQEKIVNNIIGSVEAINQNLMEYLDMNINSNKENVTVFSIVTSILLVLIDIFVFNNIYEEKVKEMNALVSFVFLMPKNIVNKNDKFKKFLETGSFDN